MIRWILFFILGFSLQVKASIQKSEFSFIKLDSEILLYIDHPIHLRHLFNDWYLINNNEALALLDQVDAELFINDIEDNKSWSTTTPLPEQYLKNPEPIDELDTYFLSGLNDPKMKYFIPYRAPKKNGIGMKKFYEDYPGEDALEVIVAVVDTGVDYYHRDLANKMWINKEEIPDNGIDDDENGYIDDVYGINTLVRDDNGLPTTDPFDGQFHGTHVAGIIAAEHNNGEGIGGVSRHAKIMAIRTVPSDQSDETDLDVVDAFLYAAKNGARIINCSFGKKISEGGTIVPEMIQYIYEVYGTLVVAAAGNDSFLGNWHDNDTEPTYPASWDNESLVTVASSAITGRLSSFSNTGQISVDLAAPGSDIYSTLPGNDYGRLSGTSMAAPVVSGVLAELLSRFPEMDGLNLKDIIMQTVSKKSTFKEKMMAPGIINLYDSFEVLNF
ncbi:MAG: S8 family serine peptidase [Halobacteriovoraceae bacterium]|nr:S8 family serine peptidase [Halobacteriovoraceae bacterium]